MYIKSIMLDGFKSYGHRTDIGPFDNQFNAITGLNGSGKSNILDAICFVLGITNLNQVRASNLQELIYRSGQAGVVRAIVSITFDNRNKDQSPPGFEDYKELVITRQVAVGGKNKYMLNGSTVQNSRIQDLFCSVQLNVNNPHFLIMQGRVTKVLNMKPAEILAMIEEAAGTRMYEVKRLRALKTIQDKEAKLQELNQINNEEITPRLEKLREERAAYLEYQRVERELEHMMGIFQVWLFLDSKRSNANAEKVLNEGYAKVQSINDLINQNKGEITKLEDEVNSMTAVMQSTAGAKLQTIEAQLKENEKAEAKASAAEKAAKENISAEEKKITQLEKNLNSDEAVLKTKEQELQKVEGLFQQLREADAADNEAFAASQRKYEAISVGMEVNDAGETETLQDQLIAAKQQATQSNTEMKQATMEINHLKKQLNEKRRESGSNPADYQRDTAHLKSMEKEVQNLENNLKKLNYPEERMQELLTQKPILLNEIRQLQERVERFYSHYYYTNFKYRDPETNFNRRCVHGVVCRLFKVKDPKYCVALETAAGGRLYNVVVDTEVTAKKLVQRGNLQYRTTFIPLNKITGGKIENRTIKTAQDLFGKDNVQSGLSLVNYNAHLQPAIEHVLGNVLVCKDLDIARQVAFHKQIKCKCVTLDGDVVDPAGVLSGGARKKEVPILLQLDDIKKYEEQLNIKEKELENIEQEIKQMSHTQQQWSSVKTQLELRQHELGLIRQRLQNTAHHQQQQETENIKNNINQLTERIQVCKETEMKCNKKIKELEIKMKDTKGHKERLLKEAEDEMKKLKKKADNSRKNWKQREQEYEMLTLEISELKKSLENIKQQIANGRDNLVQLKEQLAELKNDAEQKKESVTKLQQEYKVEKGTIMEKNKEIQKKVHKKEQLVAQISELELEIKKMDHDIKKLKEDAKNAKKREAEFASKIKDDDKNMKAAQDLGNAEAAELEKRIRSAQDKKVKLKRTVNAKAQSMYEFEEKKFNDLLKKKSIVESDKKKLLVIMDDLDKKKEEAIMLAWRQISKDLGSMFSTLLPGANATLQPPPGSSVLNGLEVKVFLGGVWKESLTELSGGQRSLAALSLILSMLLFKPAPLYILDEVDAALDLSHTQNIGNIIKSHFKQSQFIIVSLKDGMFNNANVLFRTQFIDGTSMVTRTENKER